MDGRIEDTKSPRRICRQYLTCHADIQLQSLPIRSARSGMLTYVWPHLSNLSMLYMGFSVLVGLHFWRFHHFITSNFHLKHFNDFLVCVCVCTGTPLYHDTCMEVIGHPQVCQSPCLRQDICFSDAYTRLAISFGGFSCLLCPYYNSNAGITDMGYHVSVYMGCRNLNSDFRLAWQALCTPKNLPSPNETNFCF